jgi:hypothetical protein
MQPGATESITDQGSAAQVKGLNVISPLSGGSYGGDSKVKQICLWGAAVDAL